MTKLDDDNREVGLAEGTLLLFQTSDELPEASSLIQAATTTRDQLVKLDGTRERLSDEQRDALAAHALALSREVGDAAGAALSDFAAWLRVSGPPYHVAIRQTNSGLVGCVYYEPGGRAIHIGTTFLRTPGQASQDQIVREAMEIAKSHRADPASHLVGNPCPEGEVIRTRGLDPPLL